MSPYDTLGEKSFWRRAVAETHPFSWTDLYEKKFEIGRTDKVATAGSCFAQHIGNRMSRSGFAYIDAEPAPPLLSASERKSSGYGLYSARYGNIYTTRQLRQLLEEAYGLREPAERVWRSKDRYYDPFRPSIEPNGVSTEDEVLGMRQGQHLPAVRYCVERASVFVFTLGLTEAWSSRSDGSIYQVCPGTTPGTEDVWDADKYEFINFGFREVIADLEAAVFLMREKNPKLRVILTVSPVPLTATASGDHVLSATIYSKSVLRAVAGELAKTHEFIDYFPSFEIVSAFPMRAMLFEPNLRSVTPAGVDYVMSHFFHCHVPPETPVKVASTPPEPQIDEDDLACDEALLDAANV